LGALGAIPVAAPALDGVLGAEARRDDVMRLLLGRLREVDRVGPHVGDEPGGLAADLDALVETLGHRHGPLRPEPELAAGLLLQRTRGERRRGVAVARADLDRCDRRIRVAQGLGVPARRGLVSDGRLVATDLTTARQGLAVDPHERGREGLTAFRP
jgi:hypothetical protein